MPKQTFLFPEKGISVEAETIEEAYALVEGYEKKTGPARQADALVPAMRQPEPTPAPTAPVAPPAPQPTVQNSPTPEPQPVFKPAPDASEGNKEA